MMALTTRLPLDLCPSCGQKLDAATNLDYHKPEVGDISVCINCQSVLEWDQNMRLQFCDLRALPSEVLATVAEIVLTMQVELPCLRHRNN